MCGNTFSTVINLQSSVTNLKVTHSLNNCTPCFPEDVEVFFTAILNKGLEIPLQNFVGKNEIDMFSSITKLKFVAWAILTFNGELCEKQLSEILQYQLDYICIDERNKHDDENFLSFSLLFFILSCYNQVRIEDCDSMIAEALSSARGYQIKRDDRGYFIGHNLLIASLELGQIVARVQCDNYNVISKEDIITIVQTVFDERDSLGSAEIGGKYVKEFLLRILIKLEENLPFPMKQTILETINECALETTNLVNIEVWWEYLKQKDKSNTLKMVFDYWTGEHGHMWDEELCEIYSISQILLPKTLDMDWLDNYNKIQNILENLKVGYIGRKDYSLYVPFYWFEQIELNQNIWDNIGLEFLNISKFASGSGDNCAAISIDGAVASHIGYSGIDAIHRFISSHVGMDNEWLNLIFDGSLCKGGEFVWK